MESYKWTLSKELKALAHKELREDKTRREQALAQLREWIQKSSYIQNCRTDANFLLRFLRWNKFYVSMAKETLVKYISMRQENPNWFYNVTLNDPMVEDLINKGVAFGLPKRDRFGRRVMFSVGGNIDPNYHTAEAVMRAVMLTFETMLEDEENQIRGFSHILDESGFTMAHLKLWNPMEIARIFTTCEKCMPIRHKKLDFISLPSFLSYVYDFATKTFVSSKLRSRIKLHANPGKLIEQVDREILPAEYGGVVPMVEMISSFKSEVRACNNRILALDSMKVDLQAWKKAENEKYKDPLAVFGPTGSFRRLEID